MQMKQQMEQSTRKAVEKALSDFFFRSPLNDATMQLAYNPCPGEPGKKREKIDQIAQDVKAPITEYIKNLGTSEDNDSGFQKCVEAIANAVGTNLNATSAKPKDFAFGNIQKLINMTAKYYYVMRYTCYGNADAWFNAPKSPRVWFKNCHCPMDRIMIDKVVNQYRGEPKNDQKLLKGQWSSVSWSQIVYVETKDKHSRSYYDHFQQMVKELAAKEGLFPIEYDIKNW